jgi:hypothetical protein
MLSLNDQSPVSLLEKINKAVAPVDDLDNSIMNNNSMISNNNLSMRSVNSNPSETLPAASTLFNQNSHSTQRRFLSSLNSNFQSNGSFDYASLHSPAQTNVNRGQFNTHISRAESNLFDEDSVHGNSPSMNLSSEVYLLSKKNDEASINSYLYRPEENNVLMNDEELKLIEDQLGSCDMNEKNFNSIYFDELQEKSDLLPPVLLEESYLEEANDIFDDDFKNSLTEDLYHLPESVDFSNKNSLGSYGKELENQSTNNILDELERSKVEMDSVIQKFEDEKIDISVFQPDIKEEPSLKLPFVDSTIKMNTWQREEREKMMLFSPGQFFGIRSGQLGDLEGQKPDSERPVFFSDKSNKVPFLIDNTKSDSTMNKNSVTMTASVLNTDFKKDVPLRKPFESKSQYAVLTNASTPSSSKTVSPTSSPLMQKSNRNTGNFMFSPLKPRIFRLEPDVPSLDLGYLNVGNYEVSTPISLFNDDEKQVLYAIVSLCAESVDDLDSLALEVEDKNAFNPLSLIQYNKEITVDNVQRYAKVYRVVVTKQTSLKLLFKVRPLAYNYGKNLETKSYYVDTKYYYDETVESLAEYSKVIKVSCLIGHYEIKLPEQLYDCITLSRGENYPLVMYNEGNLPVKLLLKLTGHEKSDFKLESVSKTKPLNLFFEGDGSDCNSYSILISPQSFTSIRVIYQPKSNLATSRAVLIMDTKVDNDYYEKLFFHKNIELIGTSRQNVYDTRSYDSFTQTNIVHSRSVDIQVTNPYSSDFPSSSILTIDPPNLELSLLAANGQFMIKNNSSEAVVGDLLYSPSLFSITSSSFTLSPQEEIYFDVNILPGMFKKLFKSQKPSIESLIVVRSNDISNMTMIYSNTVNVNVSSDFDLSSSVFFPLKHNISYRSLANNCFRIDFPVTLVNSASFQVLKLFNLEDKSTYNWSLDVSRTSAFRFSKTSNVLSPGEFRQEVAITFEPREAGLHEKNVILKSQGGEMKIKLVGNASETTNKGMKRSASQLLRIREKENSIPRPSSSTGFMKTVKPSLREMIKEQQRLKQQTENSIPRQTIVFKSIMVNAPSFEKLKFCNTHQSDVIVLTIESSTVTKPFTLSSDKENIIKFYPQNFTLQPQASVYLPMQFQSEVPGRFEAEFTVKTESLNRKTERTIKVILKGTANPF